MSVAELIASVELLVDDDGKKKAILDWPIWEELIILLEDLEDAEELMQLRQSDEEVIPWEQAKTELRAGGLDV